MASKPPTIASLVRTASRSEAEFHATIEEVFAEGDLSRVADFFELGQLMCIDALNREESCGCHFREEYQRDGEAARDDEHFQHVSAWEWSGDPEAPTLHKEPLEFEHCKPTQRSYK